MRRPGSDDEWIRDEPVKYETIRFDSPRPVNLLPVLTWECHPGQELPHGCRGKNHWDVACQCWCHRAATSERSKVR